MMRIKQILTGMALVLLAAGVNAQQRPHYTQYILNNYIVNPAVTGIENYVDVKLSMRNQWVGINGAPQTLYATVHGPIGKTDLKENATSFGMKGENPRGKRYWEEYTASEPHHGLGMSMVNYKTGYINRFYVTGSYAYHMALSAKTNLAAGFGVGLSGTTIDQSKIELATAFDPVIANGTGEYRKINPELNVGLWLYSANYFAGISAQQVIPAKFYLNDASLNGSTSVPHLFATAGYRFFLTEDISALPSVMFRYISSMPLFKDINVKLQYQDRFWIGGSYRFNEGFAGMAGINISNTFNIGYAYDVNNSKYMLGSMQRGTHEIVLGFLLNNKYGDMCPRNVW
jgi:type IX secretion system PorP/SprF family membrane protein